MQHLYNIRTVEKTGVKTADGKTVYGGAALMRLVKLTNAKYISTGERAVTKFLDVKISDIDPALKEAGRKFLQHIV